MRSNLVLFALFLNLAFSARSEAVVRNGFKYFQVCITAGSCVVQRVSIDSGGFSYLINEGQIYPPFGSPVTVGGVRRDNISGEYIGAISANELQSLKDAGMETVVLNPEEVQGEIDKVQEEIDEGLAKCLLGTVTCVGGWLASLGRGYVAFIGASVACSIIYLECKTLERANVLLFKKREELKIKLKQTAEAQTGGGGIGIGPGTGVGGSSPGSLGTSGGRMVWNCRESLVTVLEAGVDSSESSQICGWMPAIE